MGLKKYFSKRNFKITDEPHGRVRKSGPKLIYVIQKHHARRLHYDFRLEWEGTLKSWAVPKGPSLNPKDKRLAVEVEDHPIDYATFEGDIPKGQYGGGHVIVWDQGYWDPIGDIDAGLKKGHIDFQLNGEKLQGRWSLIRLREGEMGKKNWLLLKKNDEAARTDYDVTEEEPDSVLKKGRRASKKAAAKKKSFKKENKPRLDAPPEFVKPQLATLVEEVPTGDDWIHEIKFDGYRTLCRVDQDDVRLLTRTAQDWTSKYGPMAKEAKKIPADSALLDGEMVWVDDKGQSHFQGLQNALSEKNYRRIVYYVFDILFLNGQDLRDVPLVDRKALLEKLLKSSKSRKILYSRHWTNQGPAMYRKSCEMKLEGIISKKARSKYHSGRDGDWLKNKCTLRQEFVIGGYTDSPRADRPFGALLMGAYNGDGKLHYLGKVGTGFTGETLHDLKKRIAPLEVDASPFVNNPKVAQAHWVKPKLAGEVEYRTWTADGLLRQASFQGLRLDKKARDIHVEVPEPVEEAVKITHPDRLVYPESDIKKIDVVDYYEAVAPLIMPFLKDRPLAILRCQDTFAAGCYFQKHATGRNLVGIGSKPVHYKDKKDTAIVVESKEDLLELIQAGTLELHGWNGRFEHIEKPDQIVFDLDPESLKLWPAVVETALLIRDMLERLGLKSFVKVTGGKGLHVHVPIEPRYSWDQVKAFAKSLMRVLEEEQPKKYTTNMIKTKRTGKIFLDYLRNGYGATAVIPYSLRARAGAPVALPIPWSAVKTSLSPAEYDLKDVLKMVKKRKDPWAGYWRLKQRIKTLEPGVRARSSATRL
jgi:bifunctional non-homologous end joining protein LigD